MKRNTLTDIDNKFMVIKMERRCRKDKMGVWDQQINTTVYKIGKQQGPTLQHEELYSIYCNKP